VDLLDSAPTIIKKNLQTKYTKWLRARNHTRRRREREAYIPALMPAGQKLAQKHVVGGGGGWRGWGAFCRYPILKLVRFIKDLSLKGKNQFDVKFS
jgi:hypothetical protein